MDNILVTGGAGYIGSHVCKALFKAGKVPITYDNLSFGTKSAVQWGPLIEGDIRDKRKLVAAIGHYKPTAVIHMASSILVNESVQNPLLYFSNNISGTLCILEAMAEAGCKRIIFSSTCAIFDSAASRPIDENSFLNPLTPYAESKLTVERILHYLWQTNKVEYVCLRFFNAAGADVDGDIGECHRIETHLLPLAIKSSLTSYVLKIFGTSYPTRDGTPIRDYIHVADLADAHVLAVEYLLEGNTKGLFNLGSGTGYSVFEILNELERAGLKAKYEVLPPRQGDSHYLVANRNLATQMLKWVPSRSDITTIIETAIKWHRKNGF